MNNNVLVEKTFTVEVTGTSIQSREDAVNTAFKNIRSKIAKECKGIVISVKPIQVEVKQSEVQEYTQRFLFLFMPRKRERVKIDLLITVQVQTLDI
jgi:uncharacterized protein (TIGR03578 family)